MARIGECDNLDMIIAVGDSVRSHHGPQLRQGATSRLRESLLRRVVRDDARLNAQPGGGFF